MKGLKTFLSGLALATGLALTPMQSVQAQQKSKIIFTEYNNNRHSGADTRLWIINPDGTGLKKLADSVQYLSGISLNAASFSPDGSMITYFSSDRKHKIIDLEGKLLHSFTGVSSTSRSDEDFSWTPDSKSILIGAYYNGLYEFDLDKNTLTKILNTGMAAYDHNPVMSPDLNKIIYTHHEWGSIFYNYLLKGADLKLISSSVSNDTVYTTYDRPLNLTWMDNSNIAYFNSVYKKKNMLGYYNVETAEGKNFFFENPLSTTTKMIVSQDKKTIALITNMYDTTAVKLISAASLKSNSLDIKKPGIKKVQALAFSSDNKIFCTSEGDNAYVASFPEQFGVFAYDENFARHKILDASDNAYIGDSIGQIMSVNWNQIPVKASDLGELDPVKYAHTVGGYVWSEMPSKYIKDGLSIFLSQELKDTLWTKLANGYYYFQWASLNEKQIVTIGSRNIPGHMPKAVKDTIGNNESLTLKFPAIKYFLEQPVHVQDIKSNDVNKANIEGGDSAVVTTKDGRAIIRKNNLLTDVYNLPYATYALNLKVTRSDIPTLYATVKSIAGINPEVLLKLSVITAINDISLENKLKNYPNPFTNGTTIEYDLQGNTNVRLEVYDNFGNKVYDMEKKNEPTGLQHIQLDGSKMKSGIYYYKIISGDKTNTGKMIKE